MTKTLQELIDEAKALGIELSGTETAKDIKALLKARGEEEDADDEDEDEEKPEPKPKAKAKAVVEENPYDDYKKVESQGVYPARPLTAKAFTMASVIAAQPRVKTIVPLKDDESLGGTYHVWQENGFKIYVLKGVSVNLPEQVAQAITDEYTNTARATRNVQVRNPITNELVNMNSEERSESERARFGALSNHKIL